MSNVEALNKEALKDLSIEELLDVSLEMIEDAVGFAIPPKGGYIFTITKCALENVGKEDEPVQGIVVEYEVKETVELADANETPVAPGTKFTTNYRAGQGVQYFKTDFKEVGAKLGANNIRELIEGLNNVEVGAVLGHRKVKKQDGSGEFSTFVQVKNIQLI